MTARPFWLRKPRVNPWLLDGAIAGAALLLSLLALFGSHADANYPREPDGLAAVLDIVAFAPLIARRRTPLGTYIVALGAAYTSYGLGYPDHGMPVAVAIALYTVAWKCRRPVTATATAVLFASMPVIFALSDRGDWNLGSVVSNVAIFGIAVAWGDRKQVREAYLEQLELRASDQERERIEAAERAVSEERVRIARELHDVVAHAMSVIAVQSGVAAHVIDSRPDEAKRMMQTVNEASRDALAEMRRLLGVLRDDPAEAGELAPAPGLEALDELVARVGEAGIPVRLRVEGGRAAVPAGVDLAAYRIVQEALTNVLRHSGPAAAEVIVRYAPAAVHLEITDDGRGAAAAAASDSRQGQGLIGMRERAAMYGGTLVAGPVNGGGYRVSATLPFEPLAGPREAAAS